MVDATERIVNLALYVAAAPEPVTAEQCRSVEGYPPEQDDAAFLRMFERDKDLLRAAGLVIAIDRDGDVERYALDADATFARDLDLRPDELVLLRAAGVAMLADPGFPFARDLGHALSKLLPGAPDMPDVPVSALPGEEAPERQASLVDDLTQAAAARKRAVFGYTTARGDQGTRTVEPYGLFAREGSWYLVARDVDRDALRVFAVPRIRDLTIEGARAKTPDFERPDGFDVTRWALFPFQYGPVTAEAKMRLTGPAAGRAEVLAADQGGLETHADGSVVWTVPVADDRLLAAWAIENGPGIEILAPDSARDVLAEGLAEVARVHGG